VALDIKCVALTPDSPMILFCLIAVSHPEMPRPGAGGGRRSSPRRRGRPKMSRKNPSKGLPSEPKFADRNARRVLSRFTPGAPSRSILFILRQEDERHQTLGSAGGPRTTPPFGLGPFMLIQWKTKHFWLMICPYRQIWVRAFLLTGETDRIYNLFSFWNHHSGNGDLIFILNKE